MVRRFLSSSTVFIGSYTHRLHSSLRIGLSNGLLVQDARLWQNFNCKSLIEKVEANRRNGYRYRGEELKGWIGAQKERSLIGLNGCSWKRITRPGSRWPLNVTVHCVDSYTAGSAIEAQLGRDLGSAKLYSVNIIRWILFGGYIIDEIFFGKYYLVPTSSSVWLASIWCVVGKW